jgi:xanthine dehydrogenase/oxidase
MYGLLLNDPTPTKDKIESSFDGNICRCTGYRSILDTMKSFAVNENPIDLEELHKLKCINKSNGKCASSKKNVHIIKENEEWFAPTTMDALFDLLTEYKQSNYRIVSSNTGVGVYKNEGPYDAYISIKNIPELYQVSKNDEITIGSEISLNKLIEIFDTFSSFDGFQYLSAISSHIRKIANVSVRNVATWSGNLILKHNHLDFPSDVFICLETIDAIIKLVGPDKSTPPLNVSPLDLMTTPMAGKIIYSLNLSAFDDANTIIKTFKIMPRSQNSHAYVRLIQKLS